MQKISLFLITLILATGLIAGIFWNREKSRPQAQKITVVSTLFPLHDFVKNIGQDKLEAVLLLPPGTEAHAFEPTPSDIVKINNAKLFVYTGESMEPWAHTIAKSADKKVKIVDASLGIEMQKKETEQEKVDQHESKEEYPQHGEVDPHIWLDFGNAKLMIETIEKALSEIDPQNTAFYQANAENYKTALTKLDERYRQTLAHCQHKKIIHGGHFAFGYLTKRYDLEYVAAQGFSPDSEPTARDLAALVEQLKENKLAYVFHEELASPRIAETLARETGAKLLLLNGAHNLSKEDFASGASYLSLMENNLENLKLGLNCQSATQAECTKYQPADCPLDCAVCPPCAACSSLSCQEKTTCQNLGFGPDWQKNIVPK